MTNKNTKKPINSAMPKNYALSELLQKTENPWTELPKTKSSTANQADYQKLVTHCRFFYRTEPLVSTVIDKLVQIGVNDLVISKNKLTDNEFRVFSSLKPKLLEFAEQMALEYLLSGLVIPEVSYNKVDKDFLFSLGIKKYTNLTMPDSLFVRDPYSVKISTSLISDKPTYFVKVPDGLESFLKSKGVYPDGKKDVELYNLLVQYFPEFVKSVLAGEKEIKLENSLIFRRKYTSDNPYPIPYISSALEALHHKRKLRRMDYSVIDKIISAIMHVKVGSDEFPMTESDEDKDYLADLQSQLRMRGRGEDVLERIFQLITNHTVSIDWIFPDTTTLLNTDKYNDINQEILFGLGFPRILITGEAFKSGTSDPEIATLSPIKTVESFRRKILEIINNIMLEVAKRNGFSSVPRVQWKQVNLYKFADFLNYLTKLYDSAAISRTTFGSELGYDFSSEVDLMESEMTALRDKGLSEFGPTPNSKNSVLLDNTNMDTALPENTSKDTKKVDKNVSGPKDSKGNPVN